MTNGRTEEYNVNDSDASSDEDDSSDSEEDYVLDENELSYFRRNSDVTPERAQYLWSKQKGLCAISGLPMTFDDFSKYGLIVHARSITKPVSDLNSFLVCRLVSKMRLDMTWTQFKACIQVIHNGMHE